MKLLNNQVLSQYLSFSCNKMNGGTVLLNGYTFDSFEDVYSLKCISKNYHLN